MDQEERVGVRRGGAAAGLAAAVGLALLAGCAAPDTMLRAIDRSRDNIGRGLADAVDRADRAFGEARVEDRVRIVRAKVGPELQVEEHQGGKFSFPVNIRAPFPALERKLNIFLEFNSAASDTLDEFTSSLDENKTFTGTLMSRIFDRFDTGTKFLLYWKGGPQTAVVPFLRYESEPKVLRLFAEQQVSYRTDRLFGGRTTVHIDRLLTPDSFLRFANSAEYDQRLTGVDLEHAFIYRRPGWPDSVFSAETGVAYNPHGGDPEGDGTDGDDDGDKIFAQLRVRGKVWRPWCEYEIKPYYHYVWHHGDTHVFGFFAGLTLLYESYLRGPQ